MRSGGRTPDRSRGSWRETGAGVETLPKLNELLQGLSQNQFVAGTSGATQATAAERAFRRKTPVVWARRARLLAAEDKSMKCISLVATALFLAGCVTSHQSARQQYDFGDFPALRYGSGALAVKIVVRDVSQPSWLRTRDIFYRLDYSTPARRHRYAMSEWVATSGELTTFRLREAVASANAGFTVPTSSESGGYVLQTDLEEFTQAFMTPAASQCIVQLHATLWRSADQIVAERVFRLEIPAQMPDASGAAHCLASAVNRESEEIVEWLSSEIAKTSSDYASVSRKSPSPSFVLARATPNAGTHADDAAKVAVQM
jgi:cholesterol transport system auxiliary component